jgi:hypothetical protein
MQASDEGQALYQLMQRVTEGGENVQVEAIALYTHILRGMAVDMGDWQKAWSLMTAAAIHCPTARPPISEELTSHMLLFMGQMIGLSLDQILKVNMAVRSEQPPPP